jgi:hypothetical protein
VEEVGEFGVDATWRGGGSKGKRMGKRGEVGRGREGTEKIMGREGGKLFLGF